VVGFVIAVATGKSQAEAQEEYIQFVEELKTRA
jgi:acyl-CoA-binding protein